MTMSDYTDSGLDYTDGRNGFNYETYNGVLFSSP
jgi:hypothetical protein